MVNGVTLSYSPSFSNINSFHVFFNNTQRDQPFIGVDYTYLKWRLGEPGDEFKFNANLVSPKLGIKFILSKNDDLMFYVTGSGQMVLPIINIKENDHSHDDESKDLKIR